jgi:hypothetical protein
LSSRYLGLSNHVDLNALTSAADRGLHCCWNWLSRGAIPIICIWKNVERRLRKPIFAVNELSCDSNGVQQDRNTFFFDEVMLWCRKNPTPDFSTDFSQNFSPLISIIQMHDDGHSGKC